MSAEATFSAETMLREHLTHNIFPSPMHTGDAFAFASAAIAAVREEDADRLIEVGGFAGRAGDVVESWHLDSWLDHEEEFEADDTTIEVGPALGCIRSLAVAMVARHAADRLAAGVDLGDLRRIERLALARVLLDRIAEDARAAS